MGFIDLQERINPLTEKRTVQYDIYSKYFFSSIFSLINVDVLPALIAFSQNNNQLPLFPNLKQNVSIML